jgi:NitT/TauT family transport system substrate-binding protein
MRVGRRGALGLGLAGAASLLTVEGRAQARPSLTLQLSWFVNVQQLGEICAKRLGYYEAEGLDLRIVPGGPNVDGVASVASGRAEVGQLSSSPSLMLAVSQDIPIRAFAVGFQEHPFCFFSLKRNPVRTPQELIGKRVGIQQSAIVLLRALLARNNIAEDRVRIVPIGGDVSTLLTGQVDVATGWTVNAGIIRALGADGVQLRLWDAGVRLYAKPYYAHTRIIETRADVLARFTRATARGWHYAHENRDHAADLLLQEAPSLSREDERGGVDLVLAVSFNAATRAQGWGAMDLAIWQEQIEQFAALNQFANRAPRVEEVMTASILEATRGGRVQLG